MKKRIALLLLLALALTTVLAACNRTEATKIIPRWTRDGESYEYTVALSDFNTAPDATTHFNAVMYGNDSYYKDFVVRTGEPLDDLDEVRPIAVNGWYKLTVSAADENYDLVTSEQYLEVTYNVALDQGFLQELKNNKLVVAQGETVTLKSTTVTTVEFKHDDKQAPRKSSTTVHGFYIGKTHQEVSNYEISTEYKYESKKTVVEIKLTNGGQTSEISDELKRYTEGTFIDSNQLFMYTRSLDKSTYSFQDSPSVSVYNPFNQTLQTANFAFTSSANAILTDNTRGENGEQIFAKIPTVGVVVGGMPFLLQESVPNLQEKLPELFDEQGNGPDSAYTYGFIPYANHTPVRFRVGYISYELNGYEDAIWNALKATVSSEK